MKKIRPYIIVLVILVALIFIKAKFFTSEKTKNAGPGKDGKKPATPVKVFVVGDTKIEDKVYANGTVLANETAELQLETSGRITYLYLPEGKQVAEGTLLLKVNDAEIRAQLDKVVAKLKLYVGTEARQRQLLQSNGISKQEYELTLSDLQSLRADSQYYQTQIAKTELHAPFSGIIGVRNISKGSYITPSIIVTNIHQVNPVKIEFTLPEKYSEMFKVGDLISYKKEGSSEILTGKIEVKDPSVDLNSRSVRYRALSPNPKGLLSPGAFVKVELLVRDNANTLFVPTEAIVPIVKGKKVYVVKNNIAEEKIIETGIRTEDNIQILSGLQIGDSVVINGNFQLKNGSPVKIAKGNKK